jgi:DNA-binding transcriptional ArsR family regulator
VLRALMDERRATRSEMATATGLSKPTVSESVRRLEAAGVVVDTGERTTGRGRIGTYYALAPTAGRALVARLGLRRPGSTAIDVDALLASPHGDVARAVSGVLSALVSLADPALVLLGGHGDRRSWMGSATSSSARHATCPSKPPQSRTSRR